MPISPTAPQGVPPIGRVACSVINLSLPCPWHQIMIRLASTSPFCWDLTILRLRATPRADRNFDGVPRTDLTPRPHHYGPVLNGAADVPVTAHAHLTRRAGNRASSKSTLGTNTVSVDFDCVARPGTRAYTHELLRMPFSLLPFSRRVGSRKSQRRTLT